MIKKSKLCSKCKIEQTVDLFSKDKNALDGLKYICKPCDKVIYKENREHILAKCNNYRLSHKKEKQIYYKKYYNTINGKYKNYKASAKSRNLVFDIDVDKFSELIKSNCYYCNVSYEFVGIDRVDSSLGYTIYNVVPCCTDCNLAKNDLTQERFKELIENIYKNYIIGTK